MVKVRLGIHLKWVMLGFGIPKSINTARFRVATVETLIIWWQVWIQIQSPDRRHVSGVRSCTAVPGSTLLVLTTPHPQTSPTDSFIKHHLPLHSSGQLTFECACVCVCLRVHILNTKLFTQKLACYSPGGWNYHLSEKHTTLTLHLHLHLADVLIQRDLQ